MEATNEIIARITELMDDAIMAPSVFANHVGIDPSNFRKKLKGEQTITLKDIDLICKARNANPKWLQDDEGEKYIQKQETGMSAKIKEEIITLARKLSQNKELILKAERENEDIMHQLNTLYLQLDKC